MARTIPTCNQSFIIEALLENKRLDGRSLHQFRDLQVNYGQTFGSCYVQLGQTVIFASTEAVVDEPRLARPSEGRFKVSMNICAGGKDKWLRNIERSQPQEAVLTMRLLEKIINRINVLDLESLCLVVGKYVWCIETKIVLFNYDGNLIEAASIATIASLMHFRRPDATVTPEGDIVVHSLEERIPIPLTLFHYPICVTFQFMDHTLLKRIFSENQELSKEQHNARVRKAMQLMICDPTEEEEDFLKNVLVICANTYHEIVAIQSLGRISLSSFSKKLLSECTQKAFDRVKFITDYLKQEVARCEQGPSLRVRVDQSNFYDAMKNGQLCIAKDLWRTQSGKSNSFTVPPRDEIIPSEDDKIEVAEEDQVSLFLRSTRKTQNIGEGGNSKWADSNVGSQQEFDEESEEDSDAQAMPPPQNGRSFARMLATNSKNTPTNVPRPQPPRVNPYLVNKDQPLPPVELEKKTDEWTSVGPKKAQPSKLEQQLSKSQRKRMQKKNKLNQPPIPAHLLKKVAEPISSDSDDDEEVVTIKSEFSKKK